MSSGALWAILQDWYDKQPVPPTWAKVAKSLGVSQSTFDGWKAPSEMLRRRNLWAIHRLTGVPFKTVVDAAVEAVGLYDASRAKAAAEAYRAGKSGGVKQARSDSPGEIPPTRGRSRSRH
jgi:hypothetical protein